MCGGTSAPRAAVHELSGLSPRVRGNLEGQLLVGVVDGSIPACAGEPLLYPILPLTDGVYPRVCGGTAHRKSTPSAHMGLSPRVRGNRRLFQTYRGRPRSIPACAGEPRPPAPATSTCTVYPRVCGGTRRWSSKTLRRIGLSPRVRGNLSSILFCRSPMGSIPACAGEPMSNALPHTPYAVYPRVCGGTSIDATQRPLP